MDDGRRLDDVVGYRFAVIGDAGTLDAVDDRTRDAWSRLEAVVVSEVPPLLRDWLGEADAVIVRPDRYVVGTSTGPRALAEITAALVGQLDRTAVPA